MKAVPVLTDSSTLRDRARQDIGSGAVTPDFSPEGLLSRSHSQYIAGGTLIEMIEEDLIAEKGGH